ncbi:N-acetyl-gamma-glutamyl-phosphate reductase [Striga asiatica]|uniref:N-acetyl-gamma-glutamyl-phosphate reductase n=1 Tax=Striga asiatica TaxID=4170 RepID=A0A5A7Q1V1_STRAF|nr:N-acetyl-gamma-glutamyl-phosphate reductase [Striga asiatica]
MALPFPIQYLLLKRLSSKLRRGLLYLSVRLSERVFLVWDDSPIVLRASVEDVKCPLLSLSFLSRESKRGLEVGNHIPYPVRSLPTQHSEKSFCSVQLSLTITRASASARASLIHVGLGTFPYAVALDEGGGSKIGLSEGIERTYEEDAADIQIRKRYPSDLGLVSQSGFVGKGISRTK